MKPEGVVGKFRGRVLLQKGRYPVRIVLERTRAKIASLTVQYVGGREDVHLVSVYGVHPAVFNHDPVVFAHWSYFRTGGVSK
jgi:hypothetical protein